MFLSFTTTTYCYFMVSVRECNYLILLKRVMDPVFPFPFEPYSIQKHFMKELYNTIRNKKFGIFESPTGTGKSLSICCGTLKWLQDNYHNNLEILEADIAKLKSELLSTNSDDWIVEEYEKLNKNRLITDLAHKLDRIKKKQQKYQQIRADVMKEKAGFLNNRKQNHFDCNSENTSGVGKDPENSNEASSADIDLLLSEDQEVENVSEEDDNSKDQENDDTDVKIYISSRTHSQLSQFAGEIKRSPFGSDTRVVTLASRQHLCINDDVLKLKNIDLINERCLDMQKSKTRTTSVAEDGKVLKKTKANHCNSCPYYNQTNVHKMTQRILADILDVEDLVQNGKALKACPYYASRHALDDAQVVLLSHAGLVGGGTREGRGVRLRGHVLVVDEAHALAPALQRAHAAPLPRARLHVLLTALRCYTRRYATRLASRHLLCINQITFVVDRLLGLFERTSMESKKYEQTAIYTVEDVVIKAEIDHINFRPLVEFCKKRKLAPILHTFFLRYNISDSAEQSKPNTEIKRNPLQTFLSTISRERLKGTVTENIGDAPTNNEERNGGVELSAGGALYALLAFLERLCERSALGRVLVSCGTPQSAHLKYLLLDPTRPFLDLVGQCRSVIVAGGTMEPMSEFEELLGGHDLTLLRCDHVVPSDHVLAICLSEGPSGVPLCFSYEHRNLTRSLDEIGRILKNLCTIVPEGIVCFLPSYSYEQTLYTHMETNKIIDTIAKKKKIFREPKSATDVDKILGEYGSVAARGALMLSVVGGKLSEGLNFSDELGRCVLVVGMPYPNIKSVELQEKMNYLNRTYGGNAGNVYYENLCMKAVNQCIGRAVRHARDYACVVLADGRYSRANTRAALPAYVQKSLVAECNFGSAVGNIAKFFTRHKQVKNNKL